MSDIREKVKQLLNGSAKFIGKTAASAAKATKYKVNEMGQLSKRRELISELGAKVFELYGKGAELPEEALDLARQIAVLDTELESMRAEHAAQKAAAAEKQAVEKAARAAEKAAAKTAAVIEKSTEPVDVELPEEETVSVPTLDVKEEATLEKLDTEVPTLNV